MESKEALIDVRVKNGLTQDEMAEKLYVTRQAVSRWETGKTTPSAETLKLISKEFDISINVILGQPEGSGCQSCGMTLRHPEDLGTNADGGVSAEYCSHCYQDGSFTNDRTMEEMIETNLRFLDEWNEENGTSYTADEARDILTLHLATLKRWKDQSAN